MNFDNYIFRSHAVGYIINVPKPLSASASKMLKDYTLRANGEGRPLTPKQKEDLIDVQYKEIQSRKYTLSDSSKDTLAKLVYAHKYGRTIELNSPMITKGLEKEKEARDLLSRVAGLFLTANDERRSNDWVTGKTDVEIKGIIPDIKTSWSWESFSKILQDKPNELYLRQLDCYMDLWGVDNSVLCHILVDTPYDIVEREIIRYNYKNIILSIEGDVMEDSIPEVKQIVTNHIFSRKGLEEFCQQSSVVYIEWFDDFKEIPEEERVHMVPHQYDKVRIEQRNECIKLGREYMNTVTPNNNFNKGLLL